MKRALSFLLLFSLLFSLLGGVTAFADEILVEEPLEAAEQVLGDPVGEENPVEGPVEEPAEAPVEEAIEELPDGPVEDILEEILEEPEEPSADPEGDASVEPEEELVEEDCVVLAMDGATGTFTEIGGLDAQSYVTFVNTKNNSALALDRNAFFAGSVTITGEKPNRSVELSGSACVATQLIGGSYAFTMDDPPGEANYIYVDATGFLKASKDGAAADYAHWTFDSERRLVYMVGTTPYYLKGTDGVVTATDTEAGKFTLFGGSTKIDSGGGGSSSDTLVPVITEFNGYAWAPVGSGTVTKPFTVTAVKSVDALEAEAEAGAEGSLSYKWSLNGTELTGETGTTCNVELDAATPRCNVIQCEVTYTAPDDTTHVTKGYAGYIVANGMTGDVMLFSDIHQGTNGIADVLNGYMLENGNNLPGLVLATGDYHGGMTKATDEETAIDIAGVNAMLGGVPAFYLAGNHEGSAVPMNTNAASPLAGSTAAMTGCIFNGNVMIYTINYDEIQSEDYTSLCTSVETFLKGLTEADRSKPIIFISHSGLHVVMDNYAGGGSYNIANSDKLVDILNTYGKDYKIFFFFGHNHSKGETEYYQTAGDVIHSVNNCGSTLDRSIMLNFTYGHMGFLNDNQKATVLRANGDSITLTRVTSAGYSATDGIEAVAPGQMSVPVVQPFDSAVYLQGTEIRVMAKLAGESSAPPPPAPDAQGSDLDGAPGSTLTYQWYKSPNTNTFDAGATPVSGATSSRFTPTDLGYFFCRVTNPADGSWATSTAVYVTDELPPESPFEPGEYAIVMQKGDLYYALLTDGDALTTVPVTVKDGKVVGPVTDAYLWSIASDTDSLVTSIDSGKNLNRKSGGGGALQQSANEDKYSKWAYDAVNHVLYNISTGGGSTKYFYPTVDDTGALSLKDTTAITGDLGIYLMTIYTEPGPTPNTSTKVPHTADGSRPALWASLALAAGAGLGLAVIPRKKREN